MILRCRTRNASWRHSTSNLCSLMTASGSCRRIPKVRTACNSPLLCLQGTRAGKRDILHSVIHRGLRRPARQWNPWSLWWRSKGQALPLLAIPGPRQEDPRSEHTAFLGNEPAFTSPPLSLPKRWFCDQGHQLNVRALKRRWLSNSQRFSPESVIATDLCDALLLLSLLGGVKLYVIICQPRDVALERGAVWAPKVI